MNPNEETGRQPTNPQPYPQHTPATSYGPQGPAQPDASGNPSTTRPDASGSPAPSQPKTISYPGPGQSDASGYAASARPQAASYPSSAQPDASGDPSSARPDDSGYSEAGQPGAGGYPRAAQPGTSGHLGGAQQGTSGHSGGAQPGTRGYLGAAQAGPAGYPSAMHGPAGGFGGGSVGQGGGGSTSVIGGWWSGKQRVAAAGVLLAVSLVAGGAGAAATAALTEHGTVFASPTAVNPASNTTGKSNAAQVAAAIQPSVVSISATTDSGQDTGSGVIIRSDGVIMTNAHVVNGAQQVSVKFSDGKTAPAQILGADTAHDIAVIKASGVSGLKPATLGNSSAVSVGDPVLAVGSPLGLDGSVTSGIVSALNRTIQEGSDQQQTPDQGNGGWPFGYGRQQQQQQPSASIKNAIQTDAAINPGNSGGALVNSAGQVIGINTAIATTGSGSGSIGVGFAIPINDAKQVADQIINHGSPSNSAT